MSLLLPSIISNTARTQQPFVLLQSSLAQSTLPLLRNAIAQPKSKVLLFCLLHPPKCLVEGVTPADLVEVIDLTDRVPGYSDLSPDVRADILRKVEEGTAFRLQWQPFPCIKLVLRYFKSCDYRHRLGGHPSVQPRLSISRTDTSQEATCHHTQ